MPAEGIESKLNFSRTGKPADAQKLFAAMPYCASFAPRTRPENAGEEFQAGIEDGDDVMSDNVL
jgi:hypothetical protein